jgi:hypothetical protein
MPDLTDDKAHTVLLISQARPFSSVNLATWSQVVLKRQACNVSRNDKDIDRQQGQARNQRSVSRDGPNAIRKTRDPQIVYKD